MMTRNMSTFVSSSLVLGHAGRTAGSDSLCISTDLPAKLPRNASRCSGITIQTDSWLRQSEMEPLAGARSVGQRNTSSIWPPSITLVARASRAIFSMAGQFERRYLCA